MTGQLILSTLDHTWFIDVDGTMVEHNGHKNKGDRLLPGVAEFWKKIPDNDVIVLCSARTESERQGTLEFIAEQGLRYDHVLFDLPTGERVLINDLKRSGLACALALNVPRDDGLGEIVPVVTDDLTEDVQSRTPRFESLLREKRVSEHMVSTDGVVLNFDQTTYMDVSNALMTQNFGIVMLVDGDGRLAAVVSDGDARRAFSKFGPLSLLSLNASKFATQDPMTCLGSDSVWDALMRMEKGTRKISCLPVLDDDGRILGLVTLHSILGLILQHAPGGAPVAGQDQG